MIGHGWTGCFSSGLILHFNSSKRLTRTFKAKVVAAKAKASEKDTLLDMAWPFFLLLPSVRLAKISFWTSFLVVRR